MKFKKYKKTKAVCPICLSIIDAKVCLKNKNIKIVKTCKKHGKFEYPHLWNDPFIYEELGKIFKNSSKYPNGIIIDLTLRCNLNCPFCFALGAEKKVKFYEPSIEEIIEKIKDFKKQVFFSTVFLFGGEPTLRTDLFEIIKKIKKLNLEVCLFTNGLKLANLKYVKKLKEAGLDYVILQFDSLRDKTYEILRGKKILKEKINAIQNLKKEKIQTDIFAVIVKNVNDDEIKDIVLFSSKNAEIIKNVYISTITYEGRYTHKFENITNSERLKLIEKQLQITKKDFLECTEFDHYLVEFIKMLTGIKCKRLSACDIMCYLFSCNSNRIIPLNRIIHLKNLTKFFKESINLMTQKSKVKYIRLLINFFRLILNQKIILNSKYFLSILESIFPSFKPILYRRPIRNKFKRIFRVIITQFQDRYNLDLDTFKYCNLWAEMPDGSIGPFCEKIIFKRC